MGKCRYCNFEENGDVPQNRLYFPNIKIGELGGRSMFLSGLLLEGNKLVYSVDSPYSSSMPSDICRIKIKYCPMCGRKLEPIKWS